MDDLSMRNFHWKHDSELIKQFHEDIVVSSFPPKDMSEQTYRQKLRLSKKHGLPAYIKELRRAYEEGKDGMFIWEIKGTVVGWSWLKIHENEFFKEGAYGEVNEIYVKPEWRRKGIGKAMMIHGHNWFKEKGINTVRVETAVSNQVTMMLYKKLGYKAHYTSMEKTFRKRKANPNVCERSLYFSQMTASDTNLNPLSSLNPVHL